MRLIFLSILLLWASAGWTGCGRDVSPQTPRMQSISLNSQTTATVYSPEDGATPPGILLVPAPGGAAPDWRPLAMHLARQGYLALALETLPKGRLISPADPAENAWQEALSAMDQGVAWMLEHGADEKNIAVLGADFGGTLAMIYARDYEVAQAVVVLSPQQQQHGVDALSAMAALPKRPVLLLAGEEDAYAASSLKALYQASKGFCEHRLYTGAAHGADLANGSRDALTHITDWLGKTIGMKKTKPGGEGTGA